MTQPEQELPPQMSTAQMDAAVIWYRGTVNPTNGGQPLAVDMPLFFWGAWVMVQRRSGDPELTAYPAHMVGELRGLRRIAPPRQ